MHGTGRFISCSRNFNDGPFREKLDLLETKPTASILLQLSVAAKFYSFPTSKKALSDNFHIF